MPAFAAVLLVALGCLMVAGWVHTENQARRHPGATARIYRVHRRYLRSVGFALLWPGYVALLVLLCLLPVSPLWYSLAVLGLPFAYLTGQEMALQAFGDSEDVVSPRSSIH